MNTPLKRSGMTEQNCPDGEKSLVSPVKSQGTEDKGMGLTDDDFMLIIMSEAQIARIQQLYKSSTETATNSTHGTNAYDYQLTTLTTVDDEHAEGFPFAFCFSSHLCGMKTERA